MELFFQKIPQLFIRIVKVERFSGNSVNYGRTCCNKFQVVIREATKCRNEERVNSIEGYVVVSQE